MRFTHDFSLQEALFRKIAHETKCLSPITGLLNFLIEAKRDPNVKIALVTNAMRLNAEFLLNNLSVVGKSMNFSIIKLKYADPYFFPNLRNFKFPSFILPSGFTAISHVISCN